MNEWVKVTVDAIAINGLGNSQIMYDCTNTFTLTSRIEIPGDTNAVVKWRLTTNANTATLSTNATNYSYKFSLADQGSVILEVMYNYFGKVNNTAQSGSAIGTNEILFLIANPFILAVIPSNPYDYATVSELTPVRVVFKGVLATNTVTPNALKLLSTDDGNLSSSVKLTLTNYLGIAGTAVDVYTRLDNNDFMKSFGLAVMNTIYETNGTRLTNNFFDSKYRIQNGNFYYQEFFTLVDRNVGGLITFTGVETKDIAADIYKDVLPFDAYIESEWVDPEQDSIVYGINAEFGKLQDFKLINSDTYAPYFRIKAHDSSRVPFTNLRKDMKVSIAYPDANNDGIVDVLDVRGNKIRERDLVLCVYNVANQEWEVIEESEVDVRNNRVIAPVDVFGLYCIMGYKVETEACFSYPNPANTDETEIKISMNLLKDALVSVKIYDVTGRYVRSIDEQLIQAGMYTHRRAEDQPLTWDGKNDIGSPVVNGVYLLRVRIKYVDNSRDDVIILKQGIYK
jgi:hypothetical protein